LHELWRNLIEAIGRVSAFTRSYFQEAHPVSFNKNVLTIGFAPEFEDHVSLVDVPRNHTLIQTKLAEFGLPNSQVKFVKSEAPAGWRQPESTLQAAPPARPVAQPKAASSAPAAPAAPASAAPKEKPAPVAFSKDDFKNDPLIQKALEVFKGQIVEVRA
jgi:DNA polymerase-3 subunit gamma/tau